MNALRLFVCLGVMACFAQAQAEGGCPPGQIPYSGTSIGSCGPIPAQNGASGGAVWASRWGAIASDGTGIYGIAEGLRRRSEAKRQALDDCKRRAGKACKLHFAYKDECAVITTSDTRSFSHAAKTQDLAGVLAMRACEDSDSGECRIYYAGCSLPARIQ